MLFHGIDVFRINEVVVLLLDFLIVGDRLKFKVLTVTLGKVTVDHLPSARFEVLVRHESHG